MEATVLVRALRYTEPQVLMAVVTIACEGCGDYTIVLPGHHLQAVIQALQMVVDAEPELTTGGETTVAIPLHEVHPERN